MNYDLLFKLAVLALGAAGLGFAIFKRLFQPSPWLLAEKGGGAVPYLIGAGGAFLVSVMVPAMVMAMAAENAQGVIPPEAKALPPSTRQLALGLCLGGVIGMAAAAAMWRMVRRIEGPPVGGVRDGVRGTVAGMGWAVVWLPVVMGVSIVATWVLVLVRHEEPVVMAHVLLGPMVDAHEPLAWRVMLIAAAVLVVPAAEEIVYRGLLLPGLVRAAGNTWAGVIVGSVFFAIVHYGSVPAGTFGAAAPTLMTLAVGLSLVHIRTKSIMAPIAMHAGFNALNIGLALLVTAFPGEAPVHPVT